MAISERDNLLKAYKHEMPDHLPDLMEGAFILFESNGFMERPFDNQGGLDWFGTPWVYNVAGAAPVPDHTFPPMLNDVSEWREKIVFPDLDKWDWDAAVVNDKVAEFDRSKLVMIFTHVGLFERMQSFLGFEGALMALYDNPEESAELIEAIANHKIKMFEKIIQYYDPDIMSFHDDYGVQRSMIISPDLWREIFKPNLKRVIDFTHSKGKLFEMHSCGLVEKIVPDIAEIGADSFNGMCINNIPALKEQTMGKLMFNTWNDFQTYDSMAIAGTLTEENLRKMVRERVMKEAANGNYVCFPMPTNEWWEPVFMDELDKCRKEIVYK